MSERMFVERVMYKYETGDELGWDLEFAWLRKHHAAKLRSLIRSVLNTGFQQPILLGDDGRVWDGHHRLYVAHYLGIDWIPVQHARPDMARKEDA